MTGNVTMTTTEIQRNAKGYKQQTTFCHHIGEPNRNE